MSYQENIKSITEFYKNKKIEKINPQEEHTYVVPMFPYPSGKIHMGHIRNYSISNVIAAYKKSQGKKVLHPIGFDSFGLPAENAAIKNKVSPSIWTENNIAQMTEDFKSAGFDFNWENPVQTHKFDYYKFEQDIFKKAWNEGLIYKKDQYVNYDPIDKTVLSNEQVHNGVGWRTGAKVIRKKIPMYFFNMKKYAHRLNNELKELEKHWPKRVIEMQKNWINIEQGEIHTYQFQSNEIRIFQSNKKQDANAIIVGINHPIIQNWEETQEFKSWFKEVSTGGVSQRENIGKTNYFNSTWGIKINDKNYPILIDINKDEECYFDKVKLNESDLIKTYGNFKSTALGEQIGLKDWCISRQRYWGNPIPIIHCNDCGDVLANNYVELPTNLIPDGSGNILQKTSSFTECECPQCHKPANHCSDTMDTFVQSSWYFHRYVAPHSEQMIEYPDTQIDYYIGGIEHATMHLIYTRFFHKMLKDFGMVNTEEPIKKLITQGMVCKKYQKEDGSITSAKMSKSLGNIVEPKEYIEKYGSDALQMFMIFAAPPSQNFDFEDNGIIGCYRFLEDVYQYFFEENKSPKTENEEMTIEVINKMENYIIKEFEGRFNINTIIPQYMIAFKAMRKTDFKNEEVKKQVEEKFIKNLAIVAPQLSYYIYENTLKNNNKNKITIK